MSKVIFAIVLFFISPICLAGVLEYQTYFSDEYGLSVPYPPSVFEPQGEIIKEGVGRGQLFISEKFDAELVVSGYKAKNSIGDLYFDTIFKLEKQADVRITYKRLNRNKNWYVVSGFNDGEGKIFYQRVYIYNNSVKQFSFIYPEINKGALDDIVSVVSHGFNAKFKPEEGGLAIAETRSSAIYQNSIVSSRSAELAEKQSLCSTPKPVLACSPDEISDKSFAMCALVMGGCEVAKNKLVETGERYAAGQACSLAISELAGHKYDIDAMLKTFFTDSVGEIAKSARDSDNILVNIFFGIPLTMTDIAGKAAELEQCIYNAKKNCTAKYEQWVRSCS